MRSASTNPKKPQVLPQTKFPKIPQRPPFPSSSKPKEMPQKMSQNGKIMSLKSSSSPIPNFTKPSSKSSMKSLKTMPQTVRGNQNEQKIKVFMNQNAKLNAESIKTEPNRKNQPQNTARLREKPNKITRQNTIQTTKKEIREEPLKQQEITIKPNPTFPSISWEDFQADPAENSWFLAQIYWGVSYNTRVKETPSGFKVEVCAYCYINKARSWVKSEYDELLEHEQGHFNIGHLCALAFQKKVQRTKFDPKNYRQEVQRMYDENMREYCEMERNYDKETCHMMDSDMQRRWNNDLQEKLKELSG